MSQPSWSEQQRDILRKNWLTSNATDIGLRVGKSKSAVIGEAHRLELPAKAPGRGKGIPRSRVDRSPDQFVPTKPRNHHAKANPTPDTTAPASSPALPPIPLVPLASLAQPLPKAPPPKPEPVKPYGRIIPCCWPYGEPGTKSFRFCNADSEPGRPYCSEHHKDAKGRGTASERAADKPVKEKPGGKLTAWSGQFA